MNVDDSTQPKAARPSSAVQGKVNQPSNVDDLVQPNVKPVVMTSVNQSKKINIDIITIEPDKDAWSPTLKPSLPQESLS